jgi:Zn-dependent metalloprotease
MNKLHSNVCGVIPPHILRNIARAGEGSRRIRRTAQATLEEMKRLASGRRINAIVAAPASPSSKGRRRKVYDGAQGRSLPGRLAMTEQGPRSSDIAVIEAFDGAGKTYDFFSTIFSRDSVDGRGLPLISTVHYGRRFDNAFWDGRQMIYGDGDNRYFNRFTRVLEVVGHEHSHAVTQYAAPLIYHGQSGALNEHLADAFGMMVKQYALGLPAEESDWYVGVGLFTRAVKGKAIRSMAAPGTAYDDPVLGRDLQPAHMSGYVVTSEDNGGVHINSGIPNKAFHDAAVAVGGFPWLVLGKIWYATLLEDVTPAMTFQQFADATTRQAGVLFGEGGPVQLAVIAAWAGVGLPPRRPLLSSTT